MLHAFADNELIKQNNARRAAWAMHQHELSGGLRKSQKRSSHTLKSKMYLYAQVITEDGSANGVWEKVVGAQKQSQQKLSQPATLDLIVSELQSQVTHAAMQPLAKTRTLEGMSGIDRWFWVPFFLARLLTSNRYESCANDENGGILLHFWSFAFVEGRRPIACNI